MYRWLEREKVRLRERKKEKVGQRDIDNMIEKGCLTYVWNVYFQDNISIWLTFIHIQVNIYILYKWWRAPFPFRCRRRTVILSKQVSTPSPVRKPGPRRLGCRSNIYIIHNMYIHTLSYECIMYVRYFSTFINIHM